MLAMADRIPIKRNYNLKTLRPKKHKQIDFFVADEFDIVNFRDEVASMEHPFFALKGGDTKVRKYRNGKTTITVNPNSYGLATIFDKDIWIYSISKLCQAMYEERPISRTIRFTAYDFFVTTNREIGGRTYKELEKALNRLRGTSITTNIIHDDNTREATGFGLIDSWRVVEEQKGRLDVGMIEITLPDWLYQAVTQTRVLKISPDYFRIRKAIDRRLYEIARKHCGNQHEFQISLEKLHMKIGSTASKAEFKRSVKTLEKTNDLPDYEIFYDDDAENIIFRNRSQNTAEAESSRKRENGKKELHKIKHILMKN
jgi:plasmid replication initiation protein